MNENILTIHYSVSDAYAKQLASMGYTVTLYIDEQFPERSYTVVDFNRKPSGGNIERCFISSEEKSCNTAVSTAIPEDIRKLLQENCRNDGRCYKHTPRNFPIYSDHCYMCPNTSCPGCGNFERCKSCTLERCRCHPLFANQPW